LHIGQLKVAQGVMGPYTFEAPREDGHRVIPRFESDVSDAPLVLPVTRADER
jgi:hypothetical protein